jgi:hypothetical protein
VSAIFSCLLWEFGSIPELSLVTLRGLCTRSCILGEGREEDERILLGTKTNSNDSTEISAL